MASSLCEIPSVCSVTFTGSFVERPGLAGISDIDVIVIVDVLTAEVFAACRAAALAVPPALLGLPDHRIHINDTFGPLKFDAPGTIVVHLMVYDLAGHRDHVLQSPFTCLDWERSPHCAGHSLRDLYPVLALQPRHFLAARRSLANYIEDIAAGSISYRCHEFTTTGRTERIARLPLDARHQGEYACHIVRNLVANYSKLLLQKNTQLAEDDLLDFWRTHLPACGEFIDWFRALLVVKRARGHDFPADTVPRTRAFLATFATTLHETWEHSATRHTFVRHARTALNDGTFLGQGRDPGILESPPALSSAPTRVLVSPALRCRLTAAALAPGASVTTDARLHEIDYGTAEGLSFGELATRYPDLPDSWGRGEDPRFPSGENTADVAARLSAFLADLDRTPGPALIVTHNVVLRCLLGSALAVPPVRWHLIPINHVETITVYRFAGRTYLDLTPEQTARITDAVAGWPTSKVGADQ
jgi:alpha-ribazole phosphatase